jgi:hypothetical protein
MKKFTLENYRDKLDHQVIHMDQGAGYNPEFRASHMMHDYPSRKLQLARAVYNNEIKASDYCAKIVFQTILSRQGERWQNFGENNEDLTDVMMLSREMLVNKGFAKDIVDALKANLVKNDGHVLPVAEAEAKWQAAVPTAIDSTMALLLDDLTIVNTVDSAEALGNYFKKGFVAFQPVKASCLGFEYFAHGLLKEGVAQLEGVIAEFATKNIDKLVVVSAQAYYMLTKFVAKFDIEVPFKVEYLVNTLNQVKLDKPSFIYAGSYNLRYLVNGTMLNDLMKNDTEIEQKNHPEFLPVYSGNKRVNGLNIWQRPVCVEYVLYGVDVSITEKIAEDAIQAIVRSNAKQVVVFEPAALPVLKEKLPNIAVKYYFDLV